MDLSVLERHNIKVLNKAPLSQYTTFRLGGPCQGLIECQTPSQLEESIRFLNNAALPYILIGGGSNLLVSDKGIDCFVIRYLSADPIIKIENGYIEVSGSTLLDDCAYFAAAHGFAGLNCTTGIPGTIGGAIVGNAGAFGQQIGDQLIELTLINKEGQIFKRQQNELGFKYRDSNLKQTKDIVVSAQLRFNEGDKKALLKERSEILAIRASKHPNLNNDPCAGSFFRNVEPSSASEKRQAAGWFLDQAGGKSLAVGGAHIYSKHANIIISGEGCHSDDVHALSLKMQELVRDKFNIELIREVRFVGPMQKQNKAQFIW